MDADKLKLQSLTNRELIDRCQKLQDELEQAVASEKYTWEALVDTSQKLQVYSASIKAAISSLLNYDIFWDAANQHEFHTTINASIDQVSELVNLIALQSRLEAGSLEFKLESHLLQEILSIVQADTSKRYPTLELKTDFPKEGNLVLVDYVYFSLALDLLLSVCASKLINSGLRIEAEEDIVQWRVKLEGINPSILDVFRMKIQSNKHSYGIDALSTDNILRLHIAMDIMNLQRIKFEILEGSQGISMLVPFYKE
jgi:K+-sensing histidine kinase KdpD